MGKHDTENFIIEKAFLTKELKRLGGREELVLNLRWITGCTLDEVARVLCVSRERVRQIEERAIVRLRRRLYV